MRKLDTWVMNFSDPELLFHYCRLTTLGGVILLIVAFTGLVLL
jgi:hypothetical protein